MASPSTSTTPLKTSTDSKVSLKVKILTTPTLRYGSNEYASTTAIDSITKTVKTIFMPPESAPKLKSGKFYLLRNVALGENLRISSMSQIMQCGAFHFDVETERQFFHPPTVSVHEALTSPRKRRLTISGNLVDVSPILSTPTTRRKVLKLAKDDQTIEVKLWGPQADLPTPPLGQTVEVSCLQISEFKGKTDANSTGISEIREVSPKVPFEGLVEAATFDMDDAFILLTGQEDPWSITFTDLLSVFPTDDFQEGVKVKGERQGLKVLSISLIEETTESDEELD